MRLPISYDKQNNTIHDLDTNPELIVDDSQKHYARFFDNTHPVIRDTPINRFFIENVGSELEEQKVEDFVLSLIANKKTYCHLDNHFMTDGTEVIDGSPSEYGSVSIARFVLSKKRIAENIGAFIVRTCKIYSSFEDLLSKLNIYTYQMLVEERFPFSHSHNCEHCGAHMEFCYNINSGKVTNLSSSDPCTHDYEANHDLIEFDVHFPSGKVLLVNGIRDLLSRTEEDKLIGFHSVNNTKSMKSYISKCAENGIAECFLNQCYPDIYYRSNSVTLAYGEFIESVEGHPNKVSIDTDRNWITFIDLEVLLEIKSDLCLDDFKDQIIELEPGKYSFNLDISQQPEVPAKAQKS